MTKPMHKPTPKEIDVTRHRTGHRFEHLYHQFPVDNPQINNRTIVKLIDTHRDYADAMFNCAPDDPKRQRSIIDAMASWFLLKAVVRSIAELDDGSPLCRSCQELYADLTHPMVH